MSGNCQTLTLSDSFSSIRASSNLSNSGVNNLSFHRGSMKKTYGEIDEDYTEWVFTEDKPLVGIYGRQSERGIE